MMFLVPLVSGFIFQQVTCITGGKIIFLGFTAQGRMRARERIEIAKAINTYCLRLDGETASSFANTILEESERYGYDWELILAIIITESQFDPWAKSHKGARGLMQVMPDTAKWLSPQLGLEYEGFRSLYDPEYNIKLGTCYLYMMHQKYGDIEKAIAAYNRGPKGLARYTKGGRGLPSRYLAKVMTYYKELKSS
jgi:soluble lytic murein transglycosylase